MKRERLKKWVEVLVRIILIISFMFIGSDCDDLLVFIISHLIALVVFLLSIKILIRYGR